MIEKPSIIITSLGRTGTKFFAELFRNIIPQATALHEPDIFNFSIRKKKTIGYVKTQIENSGFNNLFIKKAMGLWSLVAISDKRVCHLLEEGDAAEKILKQRKRFVESKSGDCYVESNVGYYGLIDLLPRVYRNYRAVFIVRDGRDWVASNMNWGEIYGKGKFRSLLAHNWPQAPDMPWDHPYCDRWPEMDRLERLCWAWSRLNNYAIKTVETTPGALWVRFEDLFLVQERYQNLTRIIDFLTDRPGGNKINYGSVNGWLEKKIHEGKGPFPQWKFWSRSQKDFFSNTCGEVMVKLGYRM